MTASLGGRLSPPSRRHRGNLTPTAIRPVAPARAHSTRPLPVSSTVLDISIMLGKVSSISYRGDRDDDEDLYAGSAGRVPDCPSQGPADDDRCAPDLGGDRPGRDPRSEEHT